MKRPLKILFLITDLGKGGAERFLLDLCHQLQKRDDVDIRIATLFENNAYTSLSSGLKISCLNYKPHSMFRKNRQPAYKKLLDEFKPDIIHTHRFLAEFLSSFHASGEVVFVCHGHDNMEQFRNFRLGLLFHKKSLLRFYEKCLLRSRKYNRFNCYFVCNSRHTETYYRQVLPKHMKSRVRLIENGIDYKRFYNEHPKEVPGAGQTLQLINVGSFQPKKNQAFLISIGLELKRRNIPFAFHLLGDGTELEKVRAKASKCGLEREFTFHGNVEAVEEYLKKAHVYVHSAWYEPFGLVLIEAMAAGLPCVVLDGKGNTPLIVNNANGFLLEEQHAGKFAESILRCTEDREIYERLSARCKEFARPFDIRLKSAEWMNFYQTIWDRK